MKKKENKENNIKRKNRVNKSNNANRISDNKNTDYSQTIFKKLKVFFVIILICIFLAAIRVAVGIYRWQVIVRDIVKNEPSKVYDTENNVIAILGNTRIIKNVSYKQLPEKLVDAYISIEDQRFYKHNGVDLPRTGAAILSYIKNMGSSSFGGSSITQQLVKNITGDNSSKVSRKIKEWFRAFAIEGIMSKEEIINSYLNIIYVGPNVYGVGAGSEYYFDKDINKLSLAECAFLAGINNSPNSYNPFAEDKAVQEKNKEKIKIRANAVIKKMLELGYIREDEYNSAKAEIDAGLKFKKGNIEKEKSDGIYSYHTDSLIIEVVQDISKKKKISQQFAENYINMSGLNIYSTETPSIQKTIENEAKQKKYLLKSKKENDVYSQLAMVIIENNTGKVVGCVGGSGEKTESRGLNRATQSTRQTGSAGKPISVLIPAIDLKLYTPITKIVDEETTFDNGTEEGYSPKDYNKYRGEITLRQAVESSQNIPFVKMMETITPKKSIKYMENMGITTLTKVDNNLNLALGGLDKGISPIQMAAAYSTIANDGIYIEPIFYERVENSNGKTIVKAYQKKKRVYPKEVAYIVKSLLEEPVNGAQGTARYCKIEGMDVAAKTGTTNEEYDRWLCGFTPYYTAATWFGFDKNETINFNRKNPSGLIWSNVMKRIHSGMKSKKFDVSSDVEAVKICKDTFLIANSGCKNTYEEYFLKGTIPEVECNKHSGSSMRPIEATSNNNPSSSESNTPRNESVVETTQNQNDELPVQEIIETFKNTINNVDSSNQNSNFSTNNTVEKETTYNIGPNSNNTVTPNDDVTTTTGGQDNVAEEDSSSDDGEVENFDTMFEEDDIFEQ
ncbi:MAG: penicillin-binding protein [Clostridia bacterium]|nr:penicillin-binding protein [Clostridia bacterium]